MGLKDLDRYPSCRTDYSGLGTEQAPSGPLMASTGLSLGSASRPPFTLFLGATIFFGLALSRLGRPSRVRRAAIGLTVASFISTFSTAAAKPPCSLAAIWVVAQAAAITRKGQLGIAGCAGLCGVAAVAPTLGFLETFPRVRVERRWRSGSRLNLRASV